MTILEMNIYYTLLDIEEEKTKAKIAPCYALVVKDNLHERVEQRMGSRVTFSDFYKALKQLFWTGKIQMGDTATDEYAKVVYKEIQSSL